MRLYGVVPARGVGWAVTFVGVVAIFAMVGLCAVYAYAWFLSKIWNSGFALILGLPQVNAREVLCVLSLVLAVTPIRILWRYLS